MAFAPTPALAAGSHAGPIGRVLPVCTAVCALMAIVGLRAPIVRAAPHSAALFEAAGLPVNLVGLDVARVSARIVMDGERKILVVDGDVANSSRDTQVMPPMRVSLRTDAGQHLYAWTAKPPRQTIAPGERIAFSARLVSPPADAVNAVVEFEAPGKPAAAPTSPPAKPRAASR